MVADEKMSELTKPIDEKLETTGSDTEALHRRGLWTRTIYPQRKSALFDLDRSNLGNARLQGLPEDVLGGDKTGVLFDWVNSVFFFSYIICQVPATVISKLFPPRLWVAGAAIGWGLSSALMSLLRNFEAGFGPAIPLYFSFFYTKSEMGLRMAYWFGFAAVAGAFGGLIAFGIQHAHAAVSNWRLLFIVEGIPPILLGILTMFYLPDRPESTSFFNEREREIAINRMNRSTSGDIGAVVNKAHVILAFRDWRIYTASISAFLPTIITTFGFSNANAQLLTVPPYAVAAVVLISIFMAIASSIGGIGYLILLTALDNNHARYFATFCITSGTYTTIGIIIAWFAHNLGSETKKATGIPMFMAIGQCGSVLGSHIFPKTDGPHYMFISYRMDNAKRDKLYGIPKPNAKVDTRELADKAEDFRYMP
ncbi:major facilitator superfamily domain-containing protein [Cyathus striatus]|nr:major facilitator superfamily domain-containing protein [Cyathus striatus]